MINKYNQFYIDNLKNVVFLGHSKILSDLQKINKILNINDLIITGSDQKKHFSREKNVFVFNKINEKFKNFINNKVKISDTLFISLGSRWIFKDEDIKKFFKNNLVNFHGTRLPYDAGGGGFSWKILRNDRINNFIVHLIEPGIDEGGILYSKKSLFPSHCKIPLDFEKYYNKNIISFYKDFIQIVKNKKKFQPKIQVDYLGRYNPRLNDSISGWIDWGMNSEDLIKFIDAFDEPYSGASTKIGNQTVKIKKAHLHGGDTPNHSFMAGIISRHDEDWLVISTKDKNMILVEIVNDKNGKNIIKNLRAGERFYTPNSKIEKSLSTKIKYNNAGLILK